jgi:hypothetical protein
VTVFVLLQSYLVHASLFANASYILPVLTVLVSSPPWSHVAAELAAELASLVVNVLICLVIILTAVGSIFKLLLVTHFNWMFSQDHERLAVHALMAAVILASAPQGIVIIWVFTTNDKCSNMIACYLMNCREEYFQLSFNRVYVLVWIVSSIVLATVVVFGIPVYLQESTLHLCNQVQYVITRAGNSLLFPLFTIATPLLF